MTKSVTARNKVLSNYFLDIAKAFFVGGIVTGLYGGSAFSLTVALHSILGVVWSILYLTFAIYFKRWSSP